VPACLCMPQPIICMSAVSAAAGEHNILGKAQPTGTGQCSGSHTAFCRHSIMGLEYRFSTQNSLGRVNG
jgi:hypothetical protein